VSRMSRPVFIDTSPTASRSATDDKRKKREPHYVFDGEKIFEVDKLTKLKDVNEVFIDSLFPEIYSASRTASRTAEGKRKKRKPHYVFDGEKIFEVDKLTKLKDVNEVYIDTLFPEIYGEVLKLLKKDIKVYLLRDTTILKKLRIQDNLKKSDEADVRMLSRVPRECFRELTVKEMELKIAVRPLINRHEWIVEKKKILKQWRSRGFDYNFGESIKAMEADRKRIGYKIVKTVSRSFEPVNFYLSFSL